MLGVALAASFWLLQCVTAQPLEPFQSEPIEELVPLPRHVWDTNYLAKRQDVDASLGLQESEQFMWASSNSLSSPRQSNDRTNISQETTDHNKPPTVVSVVVTSKQDELIIDMEKFALFLKSVQCTENMILEFRFKLAFLAAQKAWEWVNFNGIRSFVLIANWKGCGDDRSKEPWVVSNAVFDEKALKIKLVAVKSTWKKVSNTMVLDFGDFIPGDNGGHDKRILDISLDKAFTLDLSSNFPTEIANWAWDFDNAHAKLDIRCNACGTRGTLVFAGHVEASLFGGLEKFELSATPNNIGADVNLELAFEGSVDFTGADRPGREFELVQLVSVL